MSGLERFGGIEPARPAPRGSGSRNLQELVRRHFSRDRSLVTLVEPDQWVTCPGCGARADGLVTVWREQDSGRRAVHFSVCDCVILESDRTVLMSGRGALPPAPKELGP